MRTALFCCAAALLFAFSAPVGQAGELTEGSPLLIDMAAGTVSFLAEVNQGAAGGRIQHLVVHRYGQYVGKALLQAYASPKQLHDALELLGFAPGNNMTMQNWGFTRVDGQPLRLAVAFKQSGRVVDAADLVKDQGGRGLDLRFGGNLKAAVAGDASGCLVCLFSCPMGIVSNRDAFYKETGFAGGVEYRAVGLPPGEHTAIVTIGRRDAPPPQTKPAKP